VSSVLQFLDLFMTSHTSSSTVELNLPTSEDDLSGPTEWTNWVIPGHLLVGAYPKDKTLLRDILSAGNSCFSVSFVKVYFFGIY
jgi:hypothetical protein